MVPGRRVITTTRTLTMAYAKSSLEIEIQNRNEELAASQKKVHRYADLSATRLQIFRIELISFTVATLTDELDTLRNNICNSCKKNLVSVSPSASAPTPALPGPSNSASALPSIWRRAFRGRQRPRPSAENPLPRGPSNLPVLPLNYRTSKLLPLVPSEPEFAHTPGPSKSIPIPDEEAIVSSERKAEPPKWSVEYHPEAKRVLEVNLENVITYRVSVLCVRMSPDGHRVAMGLVNGETDLNDLVTGSKIWLVSDRLVQSLEI